MSAAPVRMPALFLGHGSPMIALEENATTRTWAALAQAMGKPRAVLCISAHWLTQGSAVTAMLAPRTIHDFGASFPRALFEVEYPAPGDPALAARVAQALAPTPVVLDMQGWGLDHGAWSVLCKLFPEADVPVVQLGMDVSLPPAGHFDLGRRLRPLRDEGVLILGTGNIVHNLPRMDWNARTRAPFPWAERFDAYIRGAVEEDLPERAIGFEALGEDARLSVPSPDHYWPLLYVLGARGEDDKPSFPTDLIEHGSLSMTSVLLQPAGDRVRLAA